MMGERKRKTLLNESDLSRFDKAKKKKKNKNRNANRPEKGEPDWMLEFRLKAYNYWKTLKEPKWGHVHVPWRRV